jgi:hypothetical protein
LNGRGQAWNLALLSELILSELKMFRSLEHFRLQISELEMFTLYLQVGQLASQELMEKIQEKLHVSIIGLCEY